ncbi:MAG: hypothetical protein IKQ41_03825 [Clostridia bacterium]|nr:hypothetical protein [Clostridia bacterium]
MYIIAKDGSGDFTSIQQAIDAIPGGGQAPTILVLRMDEYRERVVVNKDNVRIIGEARDRTVITAQGCARDLDRDGTERGTFLSATFMVTGSNVEVENLTVRNDAGDGRKVGQAVAVYAAGDRGRFRNVRMIAHQDTLFCGPLMQKVADFIAPRRGRAECVPSVCDCPPTFSRQYFEDCFIQGDVDFIFGPYRCWFERCTLFMNERGGFYTAANTPKEQPYGLVFHNCRLTGACGEGWAFLGRPWRKDCRTVFLNCEMDGHVSPQGFEDWDEERRVTERCAEFGTTGARADQSARHPGQKRMTALEAADYSIREVLGGWDHWQPDKRIPTWFLCGDSTMANYDESRYPMMGWGQKLQQQVNAAGLNAYVENCAVNGRSSKSFIAEKRLNVIELCLRRGDKLIVSFSHNDEKPDPERGTNPRITFPEYLSMYIDAARRQGAEPVLVTPIARRHFNEEGKLAPTHGAYPDAIRNLADYRGVRLIDLEKATMQMVQLAGVDHSKMIYCHVPAGSANYPDGLADNSHLREEGARRIAGLFLSRMMNPSWQEADFETVEAGDYADLISREDSVLS